MLYVVAYVMNRSKGIIEPVMLDVTVHKKDEILKLLSSYTDLVRVAVEFVMNNKPFFRYNLSDIKNIEEIEFFVNYAVATTCYDSKISSVGFIDKLKKIRVEYMQDGIRVYQLQ